MTEETKPTTESWAGVPVSAPAWLWLAYLVGMLVLAVAAGAGWYCVIFACAFSFQFWTFAVYRGLKRRG